NVQGAQQEGFPHPARRTFARSSGLRPKRPSDAAVSERRTRHTGGDNGNRGRRGCTKRHRDGHRARRALWTGPASPVARAHWARLGEVLLRPNDWRQGFRRRRAPPGCPGSHDRWLPNCRTGSRTARSRGILRDAAGRIAQLSGGKPHPRPAVAGSRQTGGGCGHSWSQLRNFAGGDRARAAAYADALAGDVWFAGGRVGRNAFASSPTFLGLVLAFYGLGGIIATGEIQGRVVSPASLRR